MIIPVCAVYVFYQIDRMQLGGMYYCAEDNSGIYIQDLNERSKEGYYMVIHGSEEDDDFADTDIEVIIENTADKLIAAKEREQKLAAELAKKAVTEDLRDKPNFRPKKTRR